MRSEEETNRVVEQYSDMIRRICLCHMKNDADAEDVSQKVFLKYLLFSGDFESPEHEKAWMIRVTINACRDDIKALLRRRETPLELLSEEYAEISDEHREVLEAVLSLPQKYRDVIYLYYYEGYSAAEMTKILHSRENTVYSLLSRGRAMLKDKLGGDDFDE